MKRLMLFFILIAILAGCVMIVWGVNASDKRLSFTRITQDEAKEMMEEDNGHVILDVRREDEYAAGHIPGAICIPNETIYKDRPEELPDLDQVILVYCRSGNRSKRAARMLYEINSNSYIQFELQMNKQYEKARKLVESTGQVNTDEKFEEYRTCSESILNIMGNYIPMILQREEFFREAFSVS